ncbi:hypothetical protein [Chitinophaga sp. YR573]|uniref:hypothetical protein n=1 Tax=Chitinophaga sp. YR573 TaxID=1881040 RepID=UPI0015A725C6|nr:hypothetical protein [Chitinophaga sp. YR573]
MTKRDSVSTTFSGITYGVFLLKLSLPYTQVAPGEPELFRSAVLALSDPAPTGATCLIG